MVALSKKVLENMKDEFLAQARSLFKSDFSDVRREARYTALLAHGLWEGLDIFHRRGSRALEPYASALVQQEHNIRLNLAYGTSLSASEAARQKRIIEGIPFRLRGIEIVKAKLT